MTPRPEPNRYSHAWQYPIGMVGDMMDSIVRDAIERPIFRDGQNSFLPSYKVWLNDRYETEYIPSA